MLFGSVWGITGMVMAVPMTAVIRLIISNIDHPIARFVSRTLAGTSAPPQTPLDSLPTAAQNFLRRLSTPPIRVNASVSEPASPRHSRLGALI